MERSDDVRAGALDDLTALLAHATDVDSLAVALSSYLCRLFRSAAASLVLVDPTNQELVFHTAPDDSNSLLNRVRLKRGEGIAGWVCANRRVANVQSARADGRFCLRADEVTGFYTRQVLCAPFCADGQVDGAIEVLNPVDDQPYTEQDEVLIGEIAARVGVLVANARLVTSLRRRNDELATLIDIDRTVNRVHDLEELVGAILQSAMDVTQAVGSSLVLADADSGELSFFQAVGDAKAQLLDIKIERGKGVVGACIEQGETVFVADAYADSRFFHDVDLATGFRTQSLMAVPLKTPDGVIGALELVNLPEVEDLAARTSLVEALGSQAAVALERAQLYRRLASRIRSADAALQRTNRRLADEKARLTSMIEHMADAVIMIDADNRLLMVNDAAVTMFGLGEEAWAGRSLLEVHSPSLAALLALGDTDEDGREVRLDSPPPLVLRVHSATVDTPGGDRVGRVVVCTDVTELTELAKLRTELVSFVSHELRTPLTSIKGFASALLADARLQHDDHRGFIGIIDHECDRLRRMVADLLCISRIDSGRALEVQWQRVDLVALARRVIEAQEVYSPDHAYELVCASDELRIDADSDKVEQILTNLLNNAFKYSPPRSKTQVRIEPGEAEVAIRVVDHGYGIASQDLPNLFTQYGRLRDAQSRHIGGTGLGLYLTKHLVEAHGGRVEVESALGRGSTFTVWLPRSRPWEE